MNVSIIIPAWHEEEEIVKTLDSLKKSNYSLNECEVIVVASYDDKTYSISKNKEIPEFGRYIVLKQNPGGKNTALQQGIKKAKGEIIVLLDADTLVEEDWLVELIKPIESGKADCTNGNEFPLNNSLFSNYFIIEKSYGKQFLNQKSTHGPGGIAFKRKLAKKIGITKIFDSSIKAGVDHNLGERILEAKKTILFVKEAKTKTFYNKTIKGFVKDGLRWKKAYLSLISKWKLFQILIFNLAIISSLIVFLLTFLFGYSLIFYLPFTIYLSYLLFQCITSAIISSNIGFIFYFPIYASIGIIDRIITIYVLLRKIAGFEISQNIHFKGER